MTNNFLKNIGENIKNARKNKQLSQEQLAELAGFSRNYIGMLERAEVNPPVLTIHKLAEILGLEPHSLLDET